MQKIIHEIISTPEYTQKLNDSTSFLSQCNSDLKIAPNGHYILEEKIKITNFFIYPLNVYSRYATSNTLTGYIYHFEILNETHCINILLSEEEIINYKWLKTLGLGFHLSNPSKNYYLISDILSAMHLSKKSATPFFEKTGFHFINGQWTFAASNVSIYSNKLDWNKHILFNNCNENLYKLNSSLDGITNPSETFIFETVSSTIEKLSQNINIALPIFMMNLLSVTSSVLSTQGIVSPIILWITGAPGSGKTEMALYIGSFFDKPKTRNKTHLTNNYLRANEKTQLLLERMRLSRDNTVILDDVKTDNSTSLKEHTATNTDILIRSIYDHRLNTDTIYCNAIITGEYISSNTSTLARMIVLPIKGFDESPENFDTLEAFQKNGYLITDFVILFIQWICHELNNESFLSRLQKNKSNYIMQYNREEHLSLRSSETLTTLTLGLDLLKEFCYKTLRQPVSIDSFITKGLLTYKALVKNTEYLQSHSSHVYAEVLKKLVLNNNTIRCVPSIWYKGQLNLFNYCVCNTENGIYIDNPSHLIDIQYDIDDNYNQPCLLIRVDLFNDFSSLLNRYCITNNIPVKFYQNFSINELVNCGFILVANRCYDKYSNRVLKYPVYDYKNQHCAINNFYKINLEHPLLKTIKDTFSLQKPKAINTFSVVNSAEFNDEIFNDADHENLHRYIGFSQHSDLNAVKKNFVNIFDYNFTKSQR